MQMWLIKEGTGIYLTGTWKMDAGVKNIKKLNNKTLVREILQAAAENHACSVVLFLISTVHVFTNNFITLKTERLFCFLFQGNQFPPLPSGRGITWNEGPSSTEHFGGFGRVGRDREKEEDRMKDETRETGRRWWGRGRRMWSSRAKKGKRRANKTKKNWNKRIQ